MSILVTLITMIFTEDNGEQERLRESKVFRTNKQRWRRHGDISIMKHLCTEIERKLKKNKQSLKEVR